ncbi:MAG: MBL fold metallo-hydrolase [Acidobacteriota bacterium]|nr:MBL fold metallo-hydrolase [Acidobacteriota bacterium]
MRITKYIHSCLLIENETDKILFDPGLFSFVERKIKPSQFTDLLAIILTHNHPDHIDAHSLKEIIENNPDAVVLANTEIKNKLAEKEIAVEAFETGRRRVGNFNIEAFDAPHEKILADEIPQNTAYVIDNVFVHPGDSLAESVVKRSGIKILALPTMAPWETELQTFDFAKKMSPQYVVPIHDGYAKDFFLESRYENFQKFFKRENIEFQWMNKTGDFFEI